MPPTFALLSPCGYGNLGDAAIQDALIANILLRYPLARIFGITLNPRDTLDRHGVVSFPIAAGARHNYARARQRPSEASTVARPSRARSRFIRLREVLGRIARLALPQRLRARLRAPWEEARHIVEAFQLLGSVDTLIVSGGGQLDDFWGGAWGHPWALFKWGVLARARNARLLFLSVGYGSLGSRWSRLLARLALSLAQYRSYRDAGSRALMCRAGFARVDPVFPDLAYSRPGGRVRQNGARTIKSVGISPLAYCDPRVWPRHDAHAHEAYLQRLAQAAVWLLERGHTLVFFVSAGADQRVAQELMAQVSRRAPSHLAQLRQATVSTVDGFLEQAAAVDVVVASRLHGLLLSHVAGTPTIAISYDRKVDVLMAALGQNAYALPIEHFSLVDFQQAFAGLTHAWQTVHDQLAAQRIQYRDLLARQYDRVLRAGRDETAFAAELREALSCRRHVGLLSA